VCGSKLAGIATALKLVVDAPVVLQTLGTTSIPHASHITCSAPLCARQLHGSHASVLVEQKWFKLPDFLIWCWACCYRLRWWHVMAGEDVPVVDCVAGRTIACSFCLALVPVHIILVELVALLDSMSLALILILNMEASETHDC